MVLPRKYTSDAGFSIWHETWKEVFKNERFLQRGFNMGFWREKFQAMAAAVTFAEAGEWETAKTLLRKPLPKQAQRPSSHARRSGQRVRKLSIRF